MYVFANHVPTWGYITHEFTDKNLSDSAFFPKSKKYVVITINYVLPTIYTNTPNRINY